MKPVLLLLLLFVSIKDFACPSNINQNNWRWRNNDGNESSATWKAEQSTAASYNVNQGVIRLRVEIINNSRGKDIFGQCFSYAYLLQDSLQYTTNVNDAGSWKNIGNDLSKAFVLAEMIVFVTQSTPTTSQITGTNNNFSAGRMMVSDSVTNFTISATGRTEVEWAIIGTSNMLANTTYYFRQYSKLSRVYTSYPALNTLSNPLPVKLSHFSVIGEGSKARLEWETATEQNNDRFEVQRSPDQRTWQTVTTVKGKGSSTTPVFYTAYDENPLPGSSYYRLQQFDKDGKSSLSEVVFLRRVGGGSQFTVFPNPVKGAIRFTNTGSTAENITATLSDASGKIICRQKLGRVQAGSTSTLGMATPPPGFYLLQLTNGTTTETLKLIIK